MSSTAKPLSLKPLAPQHQLRIAASKGDLGTVRKLIEDGRVDVDAVALGDPPGSGSQRSALHWAALGNHFDVAKYLVKTAGAKVLLEDKDGKTPLQMAMDKLASDKRYLNMVNLLKESATVDSKNILETTLTQAIDKHSEKNAKITKIKQILKHVNLFLSSIGAYEDSIDKVSSEYEKLLLECGVKSIIEKQGHKRSIPEEDNRAAEMLLTELNPSRLKTIRYFNDIRKGMIIFLKEDHMTNIFLADKTFRLTLVNIIIQHIVFQGEIDSTIQKTIQNIAVHVKNEKDKSRLKKKLEKLSVSMKTHSNTLLASLAERFKPYFDVNHFYNFMLEYFPGEVINLFIIKPTSHSDSILSQQHPTLEESNAILSKQIRLYRQKEKKKIEELMAKEKTQTSKHTSIFDGDAAQNTQPIITSMLTIVNEMFQDLEFELYNLEGIIVNKPGIPPQLLNITALSAHYSLLQSFFCGIQELLTFNKTSSEAAVKEKSQHIRREFLERVSLHGLKTPIDHATQLEIDSKRRKDIERKVREEAADQRTAELTFLRNQKLADQKKLEEQQAQEREKEQFKQQFLSTLTSSKKKEVLDLLNNPTNPLSKKAYLSLVLALKIEGSENISPEGELISGNSAVFHAGKFYLFTYHNPHGKKKNEVDPANTNHLVKLLASVGINKDNFLELIEKVAPSQNGSLSLNH